ncbi:hypothetical protein PsorP6_004493 [Peronosclerospora sorghi]|uniref:Uncharacterized protein n=1 Tax=Peronosclerospora sorghi TaxID=230839 RepID=A0ACC0VQ34_9STRA|nr:hypothetical protein PsorP6_004493 [Peronosclerospora sorghi]
MLMAKTMSEHISRKGAMNDETSTGSNTVRKKMSGDGTVSKGMETKSVEAEGNTSSLPLKKKVNGKKEALSIKQRLANAELLALMNKMDDVNTPKVLGKKSKKIQNQERATTLSGKRIEMQTSVPSETDVPQSDRIVRDLSIGLNSSGMTTDYESSEIFMHQMAAYERTAYNSSPEPCPLPPDWPEIQDHLVPGQKATDRPDLKTREFRAKLQELKGDVLEAGVFGGAVNLHTCKKKEVPQVVMSPNCDHIKRDYPLCEKREQFLTYKRIFLLYKRKKKLLCYLVRQECDPSKSLTSRRRFIPPVVNLKVRD